MVRPSPTWAAESPTIWVKNTALREQDRLDGELAGQRRGREQPLEAPGPLLGRRLGGHRAAILPAVDSVRRVDFPSGTPARVVVDGLRAWLGAPGEPEPLVVETSGSTGVPKRVLLSRRAVLASVAATERRLDGSGPWLLAVPPTYVAGVQVICRSLTAGHEPVLVDGSVAEAVERAGGTAFLSLVPTQLHRLLDQPESVGALRDVHTILLGGGPIDPSLRGRAEDEGLRVVATYGSAETAGGCVYDGWPLDGVEVEVEADGRIRLAGPTLFDGYDNDPELTAQVLVDGWFRTNDAGRLDSEGRLHVLGRIDDVVVSGGVNVPLPAVAARLRAHPDVATAEVVGVPDPEWGQRVVAFVVAAPLVSLEELRDWVADEHPRAWAPREVVAVDALPMLANGKVDRLALEELA
jgi:o-succinylbenzoate---CoA ligase